MQQVLNSRERNAAFLKFLLFFIITVILIVWAIFFDFRLPTKENRSLREKVNTQIQQEADQKKFVSLMNEAVSLLDSMDKNNGSKIEQINAQLISKINNEMRALPESGNSMDKAMNKTLIEKLDELRVKKKALQSLSDVQSKLDKLQTDLDNCNQKLQTANMTIQGYQDARAGGNK